MGLTLLTQVLSRKNNNARGECTPHLFSVESAKGVDLHVFIKSTGESAHFIVRDTR